MLEVCSNLFGGEIRSGDNLDQLEWTAQAFLHIAKAHSEATLSRRFVGEFSHNRRRFRQSEATVYGMKLCNAA